jgi:hypothetical protein
VVAPWSQAVIHWHSAVDSGAERARLAAGAELIAAWPPGPFEPGPTEWFHSDRFYWIWQVGVGGIGFSSEPPGVQARPAIEIDPRQFAEVVERCWIPAIYPIWGRQVLHATAVADPKGRAVAFTGPTHSGKSTVAYGLGRRPGWRLVCDDMLGFSIDRAGPPRLQLHPLKSEARLRSASAEYYGKTGFTKEAITWPGGPLDLAAIYALDPEEARLTRTDPAVIRPLRPQESYPLLLQQAYALSLNTPAVSQQLMRDYLDLTALVPTFRLSYQRGFDVFERVLDAVERHMTT